MVKILMSAVAFCAAGAASAAWTWSFDGASSRLSLGDRSSGVLIEGTLCATGPSRVTGAGIGDSHEERAWSVCAARDGFPSRLSLVDPAGNVDGYISFQTCEDGVSMLALHRTAFAFEGRVVFKARISYRDDAFPCRISPRRGDRVLSIKSGPAASLDDDALFSPSADEALYLTGGGVSLSGDRLEVCMDMTDATANAFAVRIVKDYYKSRWVPGYKPLDLARSPHAPTGWLSWNTYFDTAGSKENLDEARFAAKWFKPFGMEIWNIESWQDNSPKLPVSNFHNMNLETYAAQFPEGMKWLAGEIRKLGFRPGLWMAPFGTGNKEFYLSHKDWFLHDKNGRPVSCWNGRYTLDPTVEEAREHLKRIFDKASHDWGYEFFKIDGMSGRGPGYCAHLYEKPEIRALFRDPSCPNPFELCVKAYREGIGDDRIFLACQGHFTGAEAAYADCSRTGADIVHPNEPVKWENILLQARCTINQFFVHSVVFWSDPDCMLVSQKALGREQAQVEATVVALAGQQTFAGDKLAELAPDRVKLVQQALPVCPTRPAKLYPMFGHLPVWDLHVSRPFGDWHVAALFNWGDAEKEVGVDWRELGESEDRRFIGWEFWSGEYLGTLKGRLAMLVPARSVRLVALQPDTGRPQYLSGDRHLTQGAVEIDGLEWDEGAGTYTVDTKAVGGFPAACFIRIPEQFRFEDLSAPEGCDVRTEMRGGGILAVTVSSPRSQNAKIVLRFSGKGN